MTIYGLLRSRDERRRMQTGGGFWRATMSQHLASSGLYDEGLIDHRNARPLTIAFATIVMVWMLAFGIVSVSAQIGAHSHQTVESAASSVR
jgi:hypothetical protein